LKFVGLGPQSLGLLPIILYDVRQLLIRSHPVTRLNQSTPALHPWTFEPILLPKPWGGHKLARFKGLVGKTGAWGESWELFDGPQGASVVAEGPLKHRSLKELQGLYGPGALGWGPGGFPLMIKTIDAAEDLSVQVHPDDALAAELHQEPRGKSELWVVLEAEPGASVCAGLRPGVTEAEFRAAAGGGGLIGLLHRFPVQAGDCVNVPAGLVHSLGAGCLVAEIQQSSDRTYRLFDFNRMVAGVRRPLHLEEGLRAVDYGSALQGLGPLKPRQEPCDAGTLESIHEGPFFFVRRLGLQSEFRPLAAAPGFHVLLGLGGSAELRSPAGTLRLERGSTCLVPASLAWSILPGPGGAQLLWSGLPA
jgi:mannose-6-phosphate isomerase